MLLDLGKKGVQVRKGETGVVQEINKVQYYGQCLRNLGVETKNFPIGGLKVDEKASCYGHHKNHSSTWKQPFYIE